MFYAIAFIVFLLMHILTYFWYFKRVIKRHRLLKGIQIFLAINFLGILLYFFGRYFVNMPPVLYFLVSLSVGVIFVLFVVMLIYQPLSLIPLFCGKRREFFKKAINSFSLVFCGGYVGAGIVEGALNPEIIKLKLGLEKLAMPFRAVQISDLHIGGLIEESVVGGIVKEANALKADMIFLTGDIIDTDISKISNALKELQKLNAPLGVYFVAGNHEYFHGVDSLLPALKELGIRVLENENIVVKKEGKELINIAGVYDLFGRRVGVMEPDLKEAIKNRKDELPTILLAHQPKFALEVKDSHKIDLILSGHTHGGQIFPFRFLVRLDQPYLQGLYNHSQKTRIYVNKGTGFWGPPMRILARAEITCFDFYGVA